MKENEYDDWSNVYYDWSDGTNEYKKQLKRKNKIEGGLGSLLFYA